MGSLRGIAHQHDCEVDRHGSCGQNALGLDEDRKALFLFGQRTDHVIADFVDLTEIRACRIVKVARFGQSLQGDANIEQLALGFVPKNTNAKERRFELYQTGMGTYLTDELEFAEKWSKLINERL